MLVRVVIFDSEIIFCDEFLVGFDLIVVAGLDEILCRF